MKFQLKRLSLLLFVTFVAFSCSSDSDSDNDRFEDVPSGEIVARNMRQEALTGFSDDDRANNQQKWWTHVISDFNFSGCDDEEEDFSELSVGYFAFYPDGGLYYRSSPDGTPTYSGDWEWKNSNKNAIHLNGETSVDFEIRYLNADNVVYASYQGNSACNVVTYEQFDNPYFD